ncbi:unnamed protein product [Paramecium octaurelia]|uniref:H-type lectin domain-containing protein n=1 Tax=Paramecium octaurelia TaxID=43137 RepID=A0A8S1UB95_PAROT|nr:unnamed protein product [Paramecium octaurelia]
MKMIFVLQVVWATISYDSNTFTKFAYQYSGGSRCNPPAQKQETVYFSDVFARPPKILINTILMDTNHPFVNYTFSITTVTTQSFTFNLECFLGTIFGPVYGIVLKWLAIDDERIQIINEFNMYSFENKTYPLVNSNAETVFISLINFSYQGPVYFDILASELTKTSVSVTITDPNNTLSNLLFLGYQVILGVKEAITIIDVIKTTAIYTSPKYVTQENSWLITPFVGFYYNVNDNVRLNFTQYQDQQKIWYTIESIYGFQYYTPQTHQPTWIMYQFKTVFTAVDCITIRITQIKEKLAEFRNSFEVEIMETQQIVRNLGTTNLAIDKNYQLINLKVYARCFQLKKIQSYFNKCYGCLPQKTNQFSHNCYGAINTINYSVKLLPTIQANQELIIILSNLDCQIYQKLFNQVVTQVKLIEIKQVDI